MSEIRPIDPALAGERVVALAPGDAASAAVDWLRRPNLFAGRALTAPTLQGRQRWQAGRVAQRGQAFTAGTVRGFEVGLRVETPPAREGDPPPPPRVRLSVEPGQGLAASGEDVVLLRRIDCLLGDVPVVAPPDWFTAAATPPDEAPAEAPGPEAADPLPGEPAPRRIGTRLADVLVGAGARMSRVGVLLLQPVQVDVSTLDAGDPCDRCACGPADNAAGFDDWRIGDGVRLLWYPWPEDWVALPTTALRLRNALAHAVFDAEAALAPDAVLPWEAWGVPVALVALDAAADAATAAVTAPAFSDRAAVVRQGGRAREARLRLHVAAPAAPGLPPVPTLRAASRLPALWQARIEQFAEQLVEAGDPAPPPRQLADAFLRLPPCGLLPRSALDLENFRSDFFSPLAMLDAVPVPLEQLDLAIREAAPLAAIDLSAPQRVRLLVPVTQASWEPRLLLQEAIAPEFQQTLDRFLLTRSRELGARQGLRNEVALLARALSGQPQAVEAFDADAQAVEAETLAPWGPPPAGGGHRSALRDGAHQHYFDSATETLTPAAGEALYLWAFLDADHPPRTLMLQWHAVGTWEHRAFWGDDLLPWGAEGSAAHRRIGDLPEAGRWLRLDVPAALLGLEGQAIDGMAFTLHDGRAAYAMTGARSGNAERKWFCNVLPAAARRIGDEAWDVLTHNDLWAPFEPAQGVVPAIAASVPAAAGVPGGGHVAPARGGTHQHGFERGAAFTPGAAELLYAWVYVDPNDPPREVMLQWNVGGSWEHRATWGWDAIEWGTPGTPSRLRAGGLPTPGVWVRLQVAPAQVGIAAGQQAIAGMAFTLFDGSAAFGPAGGVTPAAAAQPEVERAWFAGALPAGAVPFGTWKFLTQRDLHAPTPTSAVGTVQALRDLLDDPLLGVLSAQERAQLALRGLGPFVDHLRSRIDRADDLTDHGFVRMQTDVYRVRQLMLGSTDASRLAVSPALAQIAHAETAIAAQAQVSDYLAKVARPAMATRSAVGASGVPARARPAASATAAAAAAGVHAGVGGGQGVVDAGTFTANLVAPAGASRAGPAGMSSGVSAAAGVSAALAFGAGTTVASRLGASTVGEGRLVGGLGKAVAADATAVPGRVGTASALQIVAARATFDPIFRPNVFTPIDVVLSTPVVGKSSIRTTAIAQRLADPKSAEARNYALATRHESLLKLLRLAAEFTAEDGGTTPGLFEGFDVYGLRLDPFLHDAALPPTLPDDDARSLVRSRRLTDFLADGALLGRMLESPGRASTDEATLFSEAVDLSDNTVALLRQLEGRIKRYRDALTRCEFALADLQAAQVQAVGRLAAAADRLAEARHDVGVARALMAEESARIAAVNERRQRVLAEEVRFVAFVRPRETAPLAIDTPRRALDPALAEAPVPACLRGHDDVPDALEAMLRVVREAPAAWFGQTPRLLERLDRPELLLRTLDAARLRSGLVVARVAAGAQPAVAAGRLGGAVSQALLRQAGAVAGRAAALNAVDLRRAAGLTWQGLRTQVQAVVSFGDLIDGDHGKDALTRGAAEAFGEIARICACLHAEFSGVPPSIRLDWAELLSEYDDPPRLRHLGNLPRWSEIDATERRRMQALADWLYAQIDPAQAAAEALVDDVVRMCLLLASHAPVDRIVAGRLPRPVVGVRPGTRIPLVALEPAARLRIGMQAVLYRGDAVVARAVIEDVGAGEAAARVLHTAAAQVDLGLDVRVHFGAAATLGAGTAGRAARAARPV